MRGHAARREPLDVNESVSTLSAPRLFVFARHAESTANTAGVINSDPARPIALTPRGKAQARTLGTQVAGLDIDVAIATRFARTQQTLEIALAGRQVLVLIEPGLDEIQAGDCDGVPIDDYWAWMGRHGVSERFPHGENRGEALRRYAGALRRLLVRTEPVTLVILHEFALRRITEAASGSPPAPDAAVANATPYLFGAQAVARAAAGLELMARSLEPEESVT
jgi:broad specificity phosphatase PhoE